MIWEGKGTGSSKHALVKLVAEENNIPDVQLVLGMVKMNKSTIPGIGNEILEAGLLYMPEAHCYLKMQGQRFDFTFPHQEFAFSEEDILMEQEIAPKDVRERKNEIHKQFIRNWIKDANINLTENAVWELREDCIKNLTENQ